MRQWSSYIFYSNCIKSSLYLLYIQSGIFWVLENCAKALLSCLPGLFLWLCTPVLAMVDTAKQDNIIIALPASHWLSVCTLPRPLGHCTLLHSTHPPWVQSLSPDLEKPFCPFLPSHFYTDPTLKSSAAAASRKRLWKCQWQFFRCFMLSSLLKQMCFAHLKWLNFHCPQ